jgi:hypothetical protein
MANSPVTRKAMGADELHPTEKGFELVAGAFAGLLRQLPHA